MRTEMRDARGGENKIARDFTHFMTQKSSHLSTALVKKACLFMNLCGIVQPSTQPASCRPIIGQTDYRPYQYLIGIGRYHILAIGH